MCTFSVSEIISYYNSRQSHVHLLMLDASSAFDRVRYCKLFRVLLSRNVSPYVIRLLLFMYTSQTLCVHWGSVTSDSFTVLNGTRQGAILSPTLFACYVDGLFSRLSVLNVGCHVGPYFAGVFGYADDLNLLCPTIYGLKRMITVCEQYAAEFDIAFNGSKSKLLVFKCSGYLRDAPREYIAGRCYRRDIRVNGRKVEEVTGEPHLGHFLATSNSADEIVDEGVKKFWGLYNSFRTKFGRLPSYLKGYLQGVFCSSFYGCVLWELGSSSIDRACVAWRKALRWTWSL